MKRIIAFALIMSLFLGLGAAVPAAAEPSSFAVWTLNNLQRAEKVSEAGAGTEAQLYALKGETTSFQVVVKAPGDSDLTISAFSVSPFEGADAGMIPSEQLDLFREHFVFVKEEQGSDGGYTGSNQREYVGDHWYPDALIPFIDPATGAAPLDSALYKAVPYELKQGENAVFWVDVNVPADAKAGDYKATYTVETAMGAFSGDIGLKVWNYEMPVKSFSGTLMGGTTTDFNNLKMFLRHRLNSGETVDRATYDQLEPLGVQYNEAGLWANISWGEHGDTMSPAPSSEEVAARKKGFEDKEIPWLTFLIDETESAYDEYIPESWLSWWEEGVDFFKGSHDIIRQKLFDWHKVLSENGIQLLGVTKPYEDMLDDSDLGGKGEPIVDIFVVLDSLYDSEYIEKDGTVIEGMTVPKLIQAAREKGCQVWSYTAMIQEDYSPAWALDYSLLNYRIFCGFLNQALGFDGMLFWRANYYEEANPWVDLSNGYEGNSLADGLLVYPGEDAGLAAYAPSIRLKAIRDGLYDYDYIQMLKNAGKGDEALAIVREVAVDYKDWSKNPDDLYAARVKLGEMLSALGD